MKTKPCKDGWHSNFKSGGHERGRFYWLLLYSFVLFFTQKFFIDKLEKYHRLIWATIIVLVYLSFYFLVVVHNM